MQFWCGTHKPGWLARTGVPLMVSRRRLADCKRLPDRLNGAPWVLDSGGFTELALNGRWTLTARQYVTEIRRYREIEGMQWAAPMDWMCEPVMIKKTGLSVADHQRRTIENYHQLRDLAPELPIIPVLQGWSLSEYMEHVEQYARSGVDLTREPVVGLGSVCRRQGMAEARWIVAALQLIGLRLHGFGFKQTGLEQVGYLLESADSMAWSFAARREPPMPGHTHKSCANCMEYMLPWRSRLLERIEGRAHQAVMSL